MLNLSHCIYFDSSIHPPKFTPPPSFHCVYTYKICTYIHSTRKHTHAERKPSNQSQTQNQSKRVVLVANFCSLLFSSFLSLLILLKKGKKKSSKSFVYSLEIAREENPPFPSVVYTKFSDFFFSVVRFASSVSFIFFSPPSSRNESNQSCDTRGSSGTCT